MNRIALPSDADHTGRDLGERELELVRQALQSGTLTSTKGELVSRLERDFAERYGSRHAYACTSGSAAIHCAVAALDLEPGDEIITTPITDMGALTAILYQGQIPAFCDVDPDSYNVTAETIAPRINERTRAVVVTHLFGTPCDMDPIVALCEQHGLKLIEDCAQAFDATYKGRPVGTIGDIGCFSFQQGKHMTTGEGGMVLTDDEDLARRTFLFINKAWGYGDEKPDHYFLAPNYRMNELTGAVALAQLEKLTSVVERRRATACALEERISDLPGITPQKIVDGATHVYWKYCVNVDPERAGTSLGDIARHLREDGIFAAPRYVGKPAFECEIFREKRTFGRSQWPYSDPSRAGQPEVDHDRANFPGAVAALDQILVIPWNEHYDSSHVEYIASSLRAAVPGAQRTGTS
jgi:perosamine synthetase